MADPLYLGLTAQSTPDQIAAAYSQFAGAAGGDNQSAQTQAVDYLTKLGISAPTITQAYNQYLNPKFESSGPLTSDLATSLMQRSMTTGVATPEFDRYGGYNAVKALYDAGGGSYTMSDFDPYAIQNYANQVSRTGVGNLTALAATNTPLTAAGKAAMGNNGIGSLNVSDFSNRFGNPANLAIENANYLKEQADIQERIRKEKLTNPQTLTPLYQSLTAKSSPAAVASAYAQFVNQAGGDTAKNQKEAVAYLQKLGVPDSVISQGYNFYMGSPAATTTGTTTGAGATTVDAGSSTSGVAKDGGYTGGAIPASMGIAEEADQPLYKGLTANSTADDIARAYYQLTGGAGGDTPENQKEAVAFLQKLGIADPMIESGYKDFGRLTGLKDDLVSSFGIQDGQTAPTQEGILSGFKYANDSGISEKDMEQVLGKDAFNTYKTGLADYAKTGIAGILADKSLSFDEAVETVKFGRALGYDTQKLADLTGTDKKVFDAIYKNYEENVPKVITSVIKESPDVKNSDDQIIKALALEQKYGFSDDDFAKALGFTTPQVKGLLDPVRNYGTEINKVLNNTDSTLVDTKKIIDSGRNNGAINKLFGTNLDTLDARIAEIEDRWKGFEGVEPMHAQRVYDQISQQREQLGDKYYQGTFGDPMKMAATLAKKGIDTLADIGQKDKYETTKADAVYTTADGKPVIQTDDGRFLFDRAMGADYSEYVEIPKDQVKTSYGRNEFVQEGDGGYSQFVPLTEEEQATLKDGKYEKLLGKVAYDKDTGKEIAGLDGTIEAEKSGKSWNRKRNELNVGFSESGVPILYTTKEKTGFGAALEQALPVIAMALPFMLPGIGAGLSSLLPGAGVAASGATAAIAPSLLNQALTQGIISGGLGALGGQDVGKSFLSGAISPVINTGISSLLPTGLDPNIARAVTGAGSGVIKGALQGGDIENLLGEGILSGLTNYGLGEVTKGLNLTPQQLNLATGIALPLIQGQKVNPMKVIGTLAQAGQQAQKARP